MKNLIPRQKTQLRKAGFRTVIITFLLVISGFQMLSVPMIRLKMKGLVNSNDETIVYYQAGATNGFDASYDAYKILGPNPAPHIYQLYNTTMLNTNGISPVVQTFSIPIKATTNITGNFTITAEDFEELPVGTCASLKDLSNGITYNILANPYTFLLKDTTTAPRFVLFITHYQLGFSSGLTQPACQSPNSGVFKIEGNMNAPWNYTWKDSTGTTIKSSLNSFTADSLDNLSSGIYTVQVITASDGCYSHTATFTINPVTLPSASFSAPDTVIAGSSLNYQPVNQSTDCAVYSWNFGNGSMPSSAFQPQYTYTVPGSYTVKLVGSSSSGCNDTMQKLVKVIDIATHINSELNETLKFADMGDNRYKIASGRNFAGELRVNVIALDGKTLLQENFAAGSNNNAGSHEF
jgi:hypothetical protein